MFGRTAAVIAATGIFGSALLGGAALAAFAPADLADRADVADLTDFADYQTSLIASVRPGEGFKGDGAHEHLLHRVLAGLFDQSATYLGTKPADLRTALSGTSLGAIADKTAGKTKTGLVASLNASVNGAIDRAQADAKITKDQADKARAATPAQIARFVDHIFSARTVAPKTPRAAGPKVQAFIGDAVSAAREYLGLTAADLAAGLRSGKSLGEVANSTNGRSRDGLVAAITTSTKAKIDKALQDGKVTADQATQLKAGVSAAVAQLVDRKGPVKASTR